MPKFSVFVPARKGTDMPDLTLRVDATNWLVALRASLAQIGEQGDTLSNIVCETAQDGAIRVADPTSKRVFVIKKLLEGDLAADAAKQAAERAAQDKLEAERLEKALRESELAKLEAEKLSLERSRRELELREAARLARELAAKEEIRRREEEQARLMREEAIRRAEVEAQAKAKQLASEAEAKAAAERARLAAARQELDRLETEKKRLEAELQQATTNWDKATNKVAYQALGTVHNLEVVKAQRKDDSRVYDDLDDWYDSVEQQESGADDVLSDMFMETQGLHEKPPAAAAGVVLGLLSKQIQCEASSVFLTDNESALKDLTIVQATGPVSSKILGVRVPLGQGIVGFSVANLVTMTVNDVHKTPNFYGKVDQEHGFQTRSILCIPVQFEGRAFGAIEALNKKGGNWTTQDLGIVESAAGILARAIHMYGLINR